MITARLRDVRAESRQPPERTIRGQEQILAAAVALALACSIYALGLRQFGGFDGSVVVDVGWRLANGQRPFRDFPCTLPIAFWVGAKYAVLLFGARWRSFVILAALFSALTWLWSIWLARRIEPDQARAWLLALCPQLLAMLVVSYWWYNPLTSVAGVLYVLASAAILCAPRSSALRASYAASLALLATTKPNVAGPLLLIGTLVQLCVPARRRAALMETLVAIGGVWALLLSQGVSPVDVASAYLGVATRGFTLHQLFQDMSRAEKVLSCLALVLALGPALAARRTLWTTRNDSPFVWLAIAALGSGLLAFLTNGEAKLVDLPLIVCSSYLVLHRESVGPGHDKALELPRALLAFACVVLMTGAVVEAVSRHRVETVGVGAFFEYQLSDAPVPGDFFAGLRAGPTLRTTVREVHEVLAHAKHAKVCFGPRMQWAYAAFGLASPLGDPPWWDPGVAFPSEQSALYARHWARQRFDLLVLFNSPDSYYSAPLERVVRRLYVIDRHYRTLVVLHRRAT
ncbi:MAG TPA: hypothetical protein VF331_09870 [Polyangiales bacterium]